MDVFDEDILNLVKAALCEDIACGDLTSIACLEPNPARATVIAKSEGVLSGVLPFMLTFKTVDSANTVKPLKNDGDRFAKGDAIFEIEGLNLTLLSSERVALNFVAHLSGVATMTSRFVEKVKGTGCTVLDTRKTTPGWRNLEKQAVVHGGGQNHRYGLYDMILIKDNHIASAGSIRSAVQMAHTFLKTHDFRLQFDRKAEEIKIEVEVTSADEVTEAIDSGVDRLLLDNQSVESLRELVRLARKLNAKIELEASGNVNLDTVADIASTGVDFVSVGALTHSAPVSDFSMKFIDKTA